MKGVGRAPVGDARPPLWCNILLGRWFVIRWTNTLKDEREASPSPYSTLIWYSLQRINLPLIAITFFFSVLWRSFPPCWNLMWFFFYYVLLASCVTVLYKGAKAASGENMNIVYAFLYTKKETAVRYKYTCIFTFTCIFTLITFSHILRFIFYQYMVVFRFNTVIYVFLL